MIRILHATANRPGAIAILQLIGESDSILRELTGVADWPLHRTRLVQFADIDEGLAVRIAPTVTQLMPHGGPRVVQRMISKLIELGCTLSTPDTLEPLDIYPEASDEIEALVLLTLSRAESPLAIDLLLDQPRRWRQAHESHYALTDEDRARSARLNRLIDPPIVVLAGAPNVGKSTLSNALLGRTMSIALDMPGTTRDYITGRIELAGLVVDWHDTPGLRHSNDTIEQKAIQVSRRLMERADLLIAMSDPTSGWPDLPRQPNLYVINKCDLSNLRAPIAKAVVSSKRLNPSQPPLQISARDGTGIAEFVSAVRTSMIVRADIEHPGPWLFDPRLLVEVCARQ